MASMQVQERSLCVVLRHGSYNNLGTSMAPPAFAVAGRGTRASFSVAGSQLLDKPLELRPEK